MRIISQNFTVSKISFRISCQLVVDLQSIFLPNLNENCLQKFTLWELDDYMKIRVHSASHITITDIDKIYVKAALYHGTDQIANMESAWVVPSNPRWSEVNILLFLHSFPAVTEMVTVTEYCKSCTGFLKCRPSADFSKKKCLLALKAFTVLCEPNILFSLMVSNLNIELLDVS